MAVIITEKDQRAYEQEAIKDTTPDICGVYGRVCRQLDSAEGANRGLCVYCGLKEFCEQ